jgi:hypothetical protein
MQNKNCGNSHDNLQLGKIMSKLTSTNQTIYSIQNTAMKEKQQSGHILKISPKDGK